MAREDRPPARAGRPGGGRPAGGGAARRDGAPGGGDRGRAKRGDGPGFGGGGKERAPRGGAPGAQRQGPGPARPAPAAKKGPAPGPRPGAARGAAPAPRPGAGPGKGTGGGPRPAAGAPRLEAGRKPAAAPTPAEPERLHKVMSRAGIASRRASEELIQAGRVTVNGELVTALGTKVIAGKDRIEVDGQALGRSEELAYVMLNKPRGVVTTLHDPEGRPTVGELVAEVPLRVFPVGRLDFDTEGLLLMTNDGELAHGLMHPGKQVWKTYVTRVRGVPSAAKLRDLEQGVELEDGPTAPARVRLLGVKSDRKNPGAQVSYVEVSIHEGRNRQVRRMFDAVGHEVIGLARTQLGPLRMSGLAPGEFRYLAYGEIKDARRTAGLDPDPPRPLHPVQTQAVLRTVRTGTGGRPARPAFRPADGPRPDGGPGGGAAPGSGRTYKPAAGPGPRPWKPAAQPGGPVVRPGRPGGAPGKAAGPGTPPARPAGGPGAGKTYTAARPVKSGAGKPRTGPGPARAEGAVRRLADKPGAKPGGKPGGRPGTRPAARPASKPGIKSGGKPGGKPVGKPVGKPGRTRSPGGKGRGGPRGS